MNDIGTEELAKILQKDDAWLADHYQEVIEKYPGKTVAIENGEVVGVGNGYREVYQQFASEKRMVMPLIIEVPHPDDIHDGFLL